MNKPIKHELAIFLIIGLLTVAIDFLLYRVLINFNLLGINSVKLAKGLSFIGGTIFAYFANNFWTFNQQRTRARSFVRFILVYLLGLGANVTANHFSIIWLETILPTTEIILLIAFIFATGVSATLNFLGMKFFVFTNNHIGSSKY
jgi:putative flippase GtrA